VGARLAARRAQVVEVRALRAKMGRIAGGAVEEKPSTPIAQGVELPARRDADESTGAGPSWAQLAPTVELGRAQPMTPTVLSSVNPLRRRVPLGARVLGIAATVAALVCAVLLSTWRAAATRDDMTSSTAPVVTVVTVVPAATTATTATATETARAPSDPAPQPAPASSAAPAARPRPAVVSGHASRPPAAASAHPHPAPPTPGPLAPSPY
jgi:hypothetical protein